MTQLVQSLLERLAQLPEPVQHRLAERFLRGRDFGRRGHAGQAVDGGAHHVVGIGRAQALGEHVLHAHHFELRKQVVAVETAKAVCPLRKVSLALSCVC